MKKKIVILVPAVLILLIGVGICLGFYKAEKKLGWSDEKCIEEFFGVSKDKYEYEIVSVKNNLKQYKYGNGYDVVISIKESKMSELVAELDDSYEWSYSGNNRTLELKEPYVRDVTGIEQDEIQYAYVDMCGLRRKISQTEYLAKHVPYRLAACYKPVDGVCKVLLQYTE